jgi:formylglycine-generating enzyme required for sulfatase activity
VRKIVTVLSLAAGFWLAACSGPLEGFLGTSRAEYRVSGTIAANNPGDPALGALVQLKQGAAAVGSPVLAGTDGSYTISGVPAGTGYSIEAALTGYNTNATGDFAVNGNVTGKNLTLVKISGPVYTISGTISTDNPGGPAVNAQVQLKQNGSSAGSPVLTGINGTYTINGVSAGFYSIEVSLSGYTPGATGDFAVSGAVTGKNLTLAKISGAVYTISGTITTDEPDGPAAGAVVQLKQSGSAAGSPVLTGTDGTYAISNVPAGSGYSIEAALTGYTTGTIGDFAVNGNAPGKNLTLAKISGPVYTVSGTITTNPAVPANGAQVQLKQGGVNAGSPVSTGPNGTYTISDVPAGFYSIEVSLSGYTAGTISAFQVNGHVTDKDLELALAPVLYTISGIISTDNPGGPASGGLVQLKQSGVNTGSPVYTVTGGTYTINDVPAGTGYSIEAALSGYITGATSLFPVNGNVTGKNLTLVKIPSAVYTVSGTITTDDPGGPASGALVQLKQVGFNMGSPVLTGTNGTYAISGVTPGSGYSIEVSFSGYTTGESGLFGVAGNAPGQNLTLEKISGPVYTVSGIISTDNPGGPVTGAVVQLKQNGVNVGSPVSTVTGGTYTINDVPSGIRYSIEAALSGYITGATVDFAVNGAVTGQNLTLVKIPSAVYIVSGTITTDDPPGGPASGALVQLKQSGVNILSPVLTGTSGTYTINGVTPGSGYSIEVSLSGYITGTSDVPFNVANNAPDKNLILMRLPTISGTITTNSPGGPASGALVQLKQGAVNIGSPVLAGIDGTYTISGVTPGTYSIEAALSGYIVGVTSAFTVNGNVTGKNLRLIYAGFQTIRTISGVSVPFRYVPAGSFRRDGTAANISIITRGYWMGETEVSQVLFQAVMGTNPSGFTGSADSGEVQNRRPVEQVSWYAAIAFCNKLSLFDGKEPVYSVSGINDWANLAYGAIPTSSNATWNAAVMDTSKNGYRLPTEMEWMWAALGADKTIQPNTTGYGKAFAGSTGSNSIGNYVWYYSNSNNKTHEAGKKQANELGLYDMSGNVWEWCWDRYGTYPGGTQTDYRGPDSGTYRVARGGGWDISASYCAVAGRGISDPDFWYDDLGFRLVVCP